MTCNLTNTQEKNLTKHLSVNKKCKMMKICLEAYISSETYKFACVSITVLLFSPSHVTRRQLKMLSQTTVHRNWINFAAREKVLNSHQMLNYSDIYLFYVVYNSETTKARQR